MEVFMSVTGCKQPQVISTFMSLDKFKDGWLKMVDMEFEFRKRKLKFDRFALTASRNRERLKRFVTDQENIFMTSLSKVMF